MKGLLITIIIEWLALREQWCLSSIEYRLHNFISEFEHLPIIDEVSGSIPRTILLFHSAGDET